jgi:hypothetical protein
MLSPLIALFLLVIHLLACLLVGTQYGKHFEHARTPYQDGPAESRCSQGPGSYQNLRQESSPLDELSFSGLNFINKPLVLCS